MFSKIVRLIINSSKGNETRVPNETSQGDGVSPSAIGQKKRKKRRTPEEMMMHKELRRKELLNRSRDSSKRSLQGLKNAGVTHFFWRSAGDCRVCEECRNKNGKRFPLNNPPDIGYPGQHECQGEGYCRCYAEPDWSDSPFNID